VPAYTWRYTQYQPYNHPRYYADYAAQDCPGGAAQVAAGLLALLLHFRQYARQLFVALRAGFDNAVFLYRVSEAFGLFAKSAGR
jgi:hypothetical protein